MTQKNYICDEGHEFSRTDSICLGCNRMIVFAATRHEELEAAKAQAILFGLLAALVAFISVILLDRNFEFELLLSVGCVTAFGAFTGIRNAREAFAGQPRTIRFTSQR